VTATVIRADARHLPLADNSVDLIVTSPPYFSLRSYTDNGAHYPGQIGSESTPAEYVSALLECTREWVRVLKPCGSIFVNLGDKYSGAGPQNAPGRLSSVGNSHHWAQVGKSGIPQKSLMGLPWRYALACIDHLGLILRAEVIWSKPNGLPESVTDRVRRSHEQWFHFVRSPRYFSAVDEIRETYAPATIGRNQYGRPVNGHPSGQHVGPLRSDRGVMDTNPLGKLPGSVWDIPSEPLTVPDHLGVDHFAAFPTEWPRRIILGWSPAGICVDCGEGRRPVRDADWSKVPHDLVEKRALTPVETAAWCADFADWCDREGISRGALDVAAGTSDMGGWWASRLPHRAAVPTPEQWVRIRAVYDAPAELDGLVHFTRLVPTGGSFGGDVDPATGLLRRHRTGTGMASTVGPPKVITGYACACPEPTAPIRPAAVLDPFGGTGTVALVATMLGRSGISVDMSADYCRLARWRVSDPGQRAKALRVDAPPKVSDDQLVLDLGGAA